MSRKWSDSNVPITQHGINTLITNPNSIAGRNASITEGRVTLGGNNPPGYINPINVRTTMQVVNIDSRFRDSYYNTTSSKFSISLPDPQKGVISLRLSSLEMPLTHYAISAKQQNATMLVITKDNSSKVVWRVRLPDGHYENTYSVQSSARPIDQAMNEALALAEPGTLQNNIWVSTTPPTHKLSKYVTYSVDYASGKSIFAAKPGGSCSITDKISGFRFNVDHNGNIDTDTNIQQRLGWQLGFRAAAYDADACVSEAPCCITGPKYGFLAINDYQRNVGPTCIVNFSNSTLNNNIIGRFSLANQVADNGIFQVMTDSCIVNPTYTVREYFGPVNIQKLEFTLYDDVGNVLDLNSCDWACALVFEKQYD